MTDQKPQPQDVLIVVAPMAPGTPEFDVRGLQVAVKKDGAAAITTVLAVRPITTADVASLFVQACEAGEIEVPIPLDNGTKVWKQLRGFAFRLAGPAAGPNGAALPKPRIIVLGR